MTTNIVPFISNTEDHDHETIDLQDQLKCDLIDPNSKNILIGSSIMKKYRRDEEARLEKEYINNLARKLTCGTFALLYLPTIICNLHFALNDKSCVNNPNPTFGINLSDFLYVDAIASLITIIVIILFVFYNITNNILDKLYNIYIHCYSVFLLGWTIIGCLIFWIYIDTSSCGSSVYKYMFVLLLIKFIIQLCNGWRYLNMYIHTSK